MARNLLTTLGIFCVLVAADTSEAPPELQISFKTLKSDLDWILENSIAPLTVNIEYAEGAVLHMTVLSKSGGLQYIKFDGILNIKLSTGSYVRKNDTIYANGSFGFPHSHEIKASLIIEPNVNIKPKPAILSIDYISKKQLTKDILEETKDMKKNKFFSQTTFLWPHFRIGSSTTSLSYSHEHKYFVFKEPLKGISLLGEEEELLGLFSQWSRVLSSKKEGSCSSSGSSSDDDSSNGFQRRSDDVYFDVWFDPKRRRFGSSSGSMGCVDAIRVYEEWSEDDKKEVAARISATQKAGSRGENVRKKVFEQDMNTAYQLLHSEHQTYKYVIINYADEIILDVRGGTDGDHRYISATGVAKAGDPRVELNYITAFYDQDKLQYSDRNLTEKDFVPGNYEKEFYFIKYIDWNTFESHLKAVETAMQGGCTQDEKSIYEFSIFYGDCIRVRYYCKTRTITVTDTIMVLLEIPNIPKAALTKCKNIQYVPGIGIESPACLSGGTTPIAVQLQPEKIWTKYPKPLLINFEVFKTEMKLLSGILIKKGTPQDTELILGTILIDERLFFGMQLPKMDENSNFHMKVYGDFTQMSASGNIKHKELRFHRAKFSTSTGEVVQMNDVFASAENFKLPPGKFVQEYVIGWYYLSTGRLVHDYLRKILEEALYRCGPRTVKTLYFKLVLHGKFGLDGFCSCSERVILVEGKFRALLSTKTDHGTEVRSDRFFADFIYVGKDQLLILGNGTLNDVFSISIPEITDLEKSRKAFGAPVQINSYSYILFKSKPN